MTTSQKKILNRLLAVAIAVTVLLLAAVLFLRREKPAETPENPALPDGSVSTPQEDPTPAPPEPDPEAAVSFAALTYSNGDTTLSFTKGENDIWTWDGDRDFPLDPTRIQQIMTALSPLEVKSTVENPGEAESYGLDETSMYLTASYTDGTQLYLEFGDRLTDSTDRYLHRSDAPDSIFVAAETIPVLMQIPIYDMMKLPRLPIPELSAITAITVRGAVETTVTAVKPESDAVQNGETATVWLEGEKDVSTRGRLLDLIAGLSDLKLLRCENFKPSEGAVTYWGLDTPSVTLEITYGSGQQVALEIGSRTLSGNARYVRCSGDAAVYSMSETALSPITTVAAFGLEALDTNDDTEPEDPELT